MNIRSLQHSLVVTIFFGILGGCNENSSENLSRTSSSKNCQEKTTYLQNAIESEQLIVCVFGSALYNPKAPPNKCKDFGRLNASIVAPSSASIPVILQEMAKQATHQGAAALATRANSLASKLVGTGAPLAAVATFVPA